MHLKNNKHSSNRLRIRGSAIKLFITGGNQGIFSKLFFNLKEEILKWTLLLKRSIISSMFPNQKRKIQKILNFL